jgi:AcrR family transcriptional regulator
MAMNTDSESAEPEVPATYAEVWGIRDRPTKGPKRGLTLDQIVATGVDVASAEGLDAVSMNRVASELGLSAMALYRYVKSKDELLDLMVDAALGSAMAEDVTATDGDWRTRLSAWAWAELAAYRKHPWALQVPIKAPSIAPNQVRWLEYGLRCLTELGIEPYERISVVLMVTSYTRSWASLSGSLQLATQSGDADALARLTHYGRFLRRLANRDEFPALFEIIDSGIFEMEDEEPDWDFRFGLNRILDGVEAHAGRKS